MRADRVGLVATLGMLALFALALYEARDFDGIGQWFPLLATSAGLLVAAVAVVMQLLGRPVAGRAGFDTDSDRDDPPTDGARGAVVVGWVAAFPVLTALIGVTLATSAWLPAFLLLVARAGWRVTLVTVVAAVAAVNALEAYLGLYLPASVLLAG